MPTRKQSACRKKGLIGALIFVLLSIPCLGKSTVAVQISLVEDTERVFTADNALREWENGNFKAFPSGGFNPGFTKSAFWLIIEVPQGSGQNPYLRIGNAHINRLDFYTTDNNSPALLYETGDHLPFNKRPINSRLFTFELKKSAESKTLYLVRVDKHHESLQLTAEIFYGTSFFETRANEQLVGGIFMGIILLIVTFCSFLFLIGTDRLYLYFTVFVLFTFFWLAADKGYGYQYFWPDFPNFASRSRPLFSSALGISALVFLKSFLSIAPENRLHKYIRFTIFTGFIPVLAFILPINYYQFPDFTMGLLIVHIIWSFATIIITLATVITESIAGNRSAWFYAISFLAFIIFSVTELVIHSGSGSVYSNYLSQYGIQTGMAVQIIILTFGLAYRFMKYRKEREDLLVRINDEQRQHAVRLREVQENERRKIAEKLHDDVGAMLSVVSLHISSAKEETVTETPMLIKKLGYANEVLRQISSTVRNLSHSLMPYNYERYGFIRAINSLTAGINNAGKIQIEQVIIGFETEDDYNKNALLDIYRIIQELLNNIIKHSEGKNAYLELIEHVDVITLIIEDNGKGINTDNNEQRGMGLSNLYAKIASLSGIVDIYGKKEGGTMVTIELPKDRLR